MTGASQSAGICGPLFPCDRDARKIHLDPANSRSPTAGQVDQISAVVDNARAMLVSNERSGWCLSFRPTRSVQDEALRVMSIWILQTLPFHRLIQFGFSLSTTTSRTPY